MKKAFTILLFFVVVYSYSQAPITKDDLKMLKNQLPGNLILNADYFEKCIWVKTKQISFLGETNMLNGKAVIHQFYFMVRKDSAGNFYRASMRYKLIYKSDDWIFVSKLIVLCANSNNETRKGEGNNYEIVMSDPSSNDQVKSNATISEGYDIIAPEPAINWLKDGQNGKFSRIRIYGKNEYTDAVLRSNDLQPNADAILKAYETIKPL